jgi:hypothetical protein
MASPNPRWSSARLCFLGAQVRQVCFFSRELTIDDFRLRFHKRCSTSRSTNPMTFKMLTSVSCLVNSRNMELCEHSSSVPQSDSIRHSHTADARLLDRHICEKHGIWLELVSEGNSITKNISVRYQLYVIGGSQAND